MMYATTTVAVHRAMTSDDLGDEDEDNSTPVAGLERLPVALTEQSRNVYDQATSELRTIRVATGRAVVGADIQAGDRLHDLVTGKWWRVNDLGSGSRSAIGGRTLSFDLRGV